MKATSTLSGAGGKRLVVGGCGMVINPLLLSILHKLFVLVDVGKRAKKENRNCLLIDNAIAYLDITGKGIISRTYQVNDGLHVGRELLNEFNTYPRRRQGVERRQGQAHIAIYSLSGFGSIVIVIVSPARAAIARGN